MQSWIPTILSALASIVTVILAYAYLKYKVEELNRNEQETKENLTKTNAKLEASLKDSTDKLEGSLKNAIDEFRRAINQCQDNLTQAVTLLKVTTAEQAIINKFTASVLSSLDTKVEANAKLLNDHSQALSIINEIQKRLENS